MNGRTVGDLSGQYTSHQWNGSSVVDYFIAPNDFAERVIEFSVGEYLPWLSDHCPTHTTIRMKNRSSVIHSKQENLTKTIPGYIWNEISKARYLEGLKSGELGNALEKLTHESRLDPCNLATEIKDLLLKMPINAKKVQRGSTSAI